MKRFCAAVFSLLLLSRLSFGQAAPRPHSIFEETPPPDSGPVRVTSAPSTAPARHAVPTVAEQAEAEQLAKELFAAEQKDPSPTARRDLAAKLLMEADRADDPTERFVILTSAKDAAAEGGDAGAISVATQKLAAEFDVDALLMKVQALKLCMPKAEGAAANGEVSSAALSAVGEALSADRLDLARAAADVATAAAARSADTFSIAQAGAKSAEVREHEQLAKQLTDALMKLKNDPNDPAALAIVGRDRCFIKGDWRQGLPMLARGNDARLQAVAKIEAGNPQDPASRCELANRWWDLRQAYGLSCATGIVAHAVQWYELALPGLSGLKRSLAEKRCAEAAALVGGTAPALPSPANGRTADTRAGSVVYVCDGSGSMMGLPFDLLKRQISLAIENLSDAQRFNVVFFQMSRSVAFSKSLLPATEPNKKNAATFLTEVTVKSDSDPSAALKDAFALHPEVVYLLTDGAFDKNEVVVAMLRKLNGLKKVRVNTIAFMSPDAPEAERRACEAVLQQIAKENGGTFKVVLTTELAR